MRITIDNMEAFVSPRVKISAGNYHLIRQGGNFVEIGDITGNSIAKIDYDEIHFAITDDYKLVTEEQNIKLAIPTAVGSERDRLFTRLGEIQNILKSRYII